MRSGASLSNKPLTSRSRLAFLPSNGSASALSKFGSPEPGTSIVERPVEWPTVRRSWNDRTERIGRGLCVILVGQVERRICNHVRVAVL